MDIDLASADKLLTTTRSVRQRLDLARPVEPAIIQRAIEIAVQAPSGSNRQGWHFMVITDPAKRAQIGAYYRQSFEIYAQSPHSAQGTVRRSAAYLSEHLGEVPVLIIACVNGRPDTPAPLAQASLYGSILPAVWSLMLALRTRGLGSSWTTLHLRYEKEIAELLGIPDNVTQAALLPVAYYSGDDFQPAKRADPKTFTYWDSWGSTRS